LSAIVEKEQEGWLCGTGAILLRVNTPAIDTKFLSFALSSDSSITWLKSHAVGAVMPNLNEDVIRRVPLLLPPIGKQKAIAHILGTLDDKIELNRSINETLEVMGSALFNSWFVEFEPVRARAEGRQLTCIDADTLALFPSSFNEDIPKGWQLAPLPSIISVNPHRSLSKGQVAPYVDMQNMPTRGHRVRSWIQRPMGSGTKFTNGDTLIARITPCLENGKTAFVDFLLDKQVGWGSTEYIVIRPREPLSLEYGYHLARSTEFRNYAIQHMTGSSGRQRVPAECFNHYMLAVPPESVAKRFGEIVRPLMRKIRANSLQSETLTELRDALLPKLLSGEIGLREAERELEQVV
jgi:type I restriction enzyme S subunit